MSFQKTDCSFVRFGAAPAFSAAYPLSLPLLLFRVAFLQDDDDDDDDDDDTCSDSDKIKCIHLAYPMTEWQHAEGIILQNKNE